MTTTDVADRATELLFERGTLVDLTIGKPTFQRKLRQADLLIEGIDESILHLGHKKLLPKVSMEALTTLEGKARAALTVRSLPFPLTGARFIRREVLPETLAALKQIRSEWQAKVQELLIAYPDLKKKQLDMLELQAKDIAKRDLAKYADGTDVKTKREEKIKLWLEQQKLINEQLYPKSEELPSLFPFRWVMFKVSASNVTEMDELAHEQFMEAQRQLKDDLRQWVRQATTEMHRTLGEAALNAKNILEKNGKLDPRNIRPLFAAFETFNSVDFTGVSEFRDVIQQIKDKFGVKDLQGNLDVEQTAAQVQLSASAFKDLLNGVANLVEEAAADQAGLKAIAKTGEFSRVIDL